MVDVTTEVIINRPLEEVASYAAEPDNAPTWYKNIQSVEWKTDKPLQKGSQLTFKAKFMGKEMVYTYEVKQWESNQRMVMSTVDGPFPMQTTYEWEKVELLKTRMKLRNNGQPKGFSVLFKPLMVRMMRKANRKDLEQIKTILEGNRNGN